MQSIKVCQDELAQMFIEASTAYNLADFPQYNDLIELQCHDIPLEWRALVEDSGICHLVFNFGVTSIFAQCFDK